MKRKPQACLIEEKVWPLLTGGKFKPLICRTYRLEEAAVAHSLMESSQHIGKIVLMTSGKEVAGHYL